MFKLIKLIIWLAGLITVSYLVINYFGYTINREYFQKSREECQKKLKECTEKLIKQGTDNIQCDINCVDPKIIIKKN